MGASSLWRQIQRNNFTDWKKLFLFLKWDLSEPSVVVLPNPKFPLNLPLRLAEKIRKNSPNDPILRQFLPTSEELTPSPLFSIDPVKEELFRTKPRLLHKYNGRALIICTNACAMNCRYCFRQHFQYESPDKLFNDEIEAIIRDSTIKEVILSGGDPLSLSNEQLRQLVCRLGDIPHVKRIRFHTRFPIGIPERVDEEFLSMLKHSLKQILMVIHCNHPNEFDEDIFLSLSRIQRLGIPILSHSVLLKDVNDDVDTLKTLFELLVDHGIMPYYLNQMDRVQGGAHFEAPVKVGQTIMKQLESLLPGYALPKYVQEIPNAPSKTIIAF